MRRKKILNLAVCLLLALSVFCSVAYLFIEAVHECHGHGCPVCAQMGECVKALAGFAAGVAAVFFYAARCGAARLCVTPRALSRRGKPTLVALKVKLSN